MGDKGQGDAPRAPAVFAETAALMAWATVGVVNAVFLASTDVPPGGITLRWVHHLYDFGHMLAVGWLCWAALRLFRALGLRGLNASTLGYLVLTAAAIGLAYLVLPNDLEGFAARFGEPFALWHNLFIIIVGLGVPLVALVGWALRRPGWRWVAMAGTIGAAAANHLMLQRDYPGAHVVIVAAAAALGASALTNAIWISKLRPAIRTLRSTTGRIASGFIALAALLSVIVWPSPPVLSEMLATDSAVLVPLIARVRAVTTRPGPIARTSLIHEDWMSDRSKRPPLEPSEPRLVPDDTILIVISAEAMRGDLLSQPQYARELPDLSALARRSLSFTEARSVGSDTRNAIGSIFTSKHYSVLDWRMSRQRGMVLTSDATPRWNELLFEHKGMPGLNLVSYAPLVNANGLIRGFQEEQILPKQKGQKWAMADAMTDAAVAKLDAHSSGPLLIFMHWMDAHDPYDAVGTQGSTFERYFREVQLYDKQVGRLWRYLEQRDLLRRTVLLFFGDHGEALGEHNIPHHGVSIYDVLLRVPFILRVPGVPPAEIVEPVSHVDIAPTLLDLMGVPIPGEYFGQSLVPFMRGQRPKLDRPIIADQRVVRSLIVGRYKIMHYRRTDSVELYDIEMDPKESDNLFGKRDGLGTRMLDALQGFFATHQIEDTYEYRR